MDVKYINPFIQSIVNVFSTMLKTEVDVGKPYLKSDDSERSDVSAVIGFSGDATGSVVLCFSTENAANIASQFAGMRITVDHSLFGDALGELANMVAGHAKSKFDAANIMISLPRVIYGEGHRLVRSSKTAILELPCKSSIGDFCVEVSMVMKPKPAAV